MSADQAENWKKLLIEIHPQLTYPELLRLHRRLKSSEVSAGFQNADFTPTKIAIVGNATVSFLAAPLEVFLAQRNIRAETFIGEFDSYKHELLTQQSALSEFSPQIVILLLDHRAVGAWPRVHSSRSEVQALADRQVKEWLSLSEGVHRRCGSSTIQSNIALPSERVTGHFEARTVWSKTYYLRLLNQRLAEEAPRYLHILDAEHLSGLVGKRLWFDAPNWYHTRQAMGFESVPALTHALASIVGALLGKTKKCLVLDLDNTLWGGIVGDVGVEGLTLAIGDPVGEAYVNFQRYCLKLKERGVLLAVCSKNDERLAREPFESHPEMVLRLDDCSAFVANWGDKATNLRRLASELKLGLDSLVFVDDNPAERALVRRFLPEVAVPELPEDPALFPRTLDQHAYFEIASLSKEDLSRASYYESEKKRAELENTTVDYDDFLKSLRLTCQSGSFDDLNLQRILQLINKTNQWNLTTRRMTEGEVRDVMEDPSYFTLWVRNGDRFGDNGIISALIARQNGAALKVTLWVMSCRVFNRGIENYVFNQLLDGAHQRGVRMIDGEYRPTDKNGLVAELYRRLGFRLLEEDGNGRTRWRFDLSGESGHKNHFINLEPEYELEWR